MKCPRCLTPLQSDRHATAGVSLELLKCPGCAGCWLESADLKAIEQVVDVRLLEWRHLPGVETQGRILFCQRCPTQVPMDKVVSTRDHRVVMDVCPRCRGVWLDKGELEAIEQKGLLSALVDVLGFLRKT